jgi:hypothetical protein
MPKRKPANKRKKLLSKLRLRKSRASTTRYVSQPHGNSQWVIDVAAERKEPTKEDAKAIAWALLDMAADDLVTEAEQQLYALKGDRSKAATAQRQALKRKIAAYEVYKRRLHIPG